MMNVIRCEHMFSYHGPLYPPRSDVSHLPATKPIPTAGDTSAKQLIFRPIPPNDRTTKDWTTIAWPTNIQSRTPDGKFGPAKQIKGWGDCWFLAPLAAVANDPNGHKILAESIQKVNGGYDVMFKGLPNKNVFISEAELQERLETEGGDADTRLIELAADRFFKESGSYKSLYIATVMTGGMNREDAERCFQDYCKDNRHDPMIYNPMRHGGLQIVAFFMLTGIYPDGTLAVDSGTAIQRSDVVRFLNEYVTNDRDGASVAISAKENPLGDGRYAPYLVNQWDLIRTEITANGTMGPQQRAFLKALDKWLRTRNWCRMKALKSAAGKLKLGHVDLELFIKTLAGNKSKMNQRHFNLLRSGVQKVLAGGPGYIGFPVGHAGTIERINEATDTFTYSEPHYPTLVHIGELSSLIQAIISRNVDLLALDPTTGQDEAESSHAGEQRGRHLRQIHHQVVRDGKIDPAESGPLANLMEMNDGAFWQAYDGDKNGVIEGGELKAVQLRVDQWVGHFELTPIW